MPFKIVIIGPESTGKSTLSAALASHYQEPWVKEYARDYIDGLQRPYEYEDLLLIAQGQLALEDDGEAHADRFLFCDTDLHVLKIWSQHKYGKTHPWILEHINRRKYDLYLLTDIDIPWEDDPQREHPDQEMRQYFMDIYRTTIAHTNIPYIILSGNPTKRVKDAINFIRKNFKL
ncbi:AAA family ATPase [Anditalea andensis]|nr:ATP-binding protein [Anditalea andensis]